MKFNEKHPVVAKLFHGDKFTDRSNEVNNSNSENAPKTMRNVPVVFQAPRNEDLWRIGYSDT
jgi:hypothetical protein